MSKPKVTQQQLRKERWFSRVIVISLAAVGILLIVITVINTSTNRSQLASSDYPIKVTTPQAIHAEVNGLHLGSPSAAVKLDAWEDFQCPICTYYTENIEPQIIQNYVETGKVYYGFHFLPIIELNSTPPSRESHQAANAALCANEQGRFWDYHDMLFANWIGENIGGFTDTRLAAIAQQLNLNLNKFRQCYQARRYDAQIEQDYAAGQAAGAQGTPSLFLNGTLLTPGYLPTYNQIAQALDAALVGH
jgi:protein-disulfide isomerase